MKVEEVIMPGDSMTTTTTPAQRVLDFYATPADMTSAGRHSALLAELPDEPLADVWGAIPKPGEALDADHLTFFDRLAELTHDPDVNFDELRELYEHDDRIRVPSRVFNATMNREDVVS